MTPRRGVILSKAKDRPDPNWVIPSEARDRLPTVPVPNQMRALLSSDVQWSELERRDRGTRFIAIQPKSIVNASSATNMIFASINPYIGCEFGCAYCYARDTHDGP